MPSLWLTLEQADVLHDHIREQYGRGILGLTDWFDLHATDQETLRAASA